MPDPMITYSDADTKGRYSATFHGVDGEAYLTTSKLSAATVIADGTVVPDSMRGMGAGAALAKRLIADARAAGRRSCRFARSCGPTPENTARSLLMSSNGNPAPEGGTFAPFTSGAFALLWTATLISNIGTWMHEVGAGWLMTTLNPDPAVVTLVQAATTLPVFCFALLAGALADRLDKRRLLIGINLALMAVVSLLALLVWRDAMTPMLLIVFTLAIGTGAAFMAPACRPWCRSLYPGQICAPPLR